MSLLVKTLESLGKGRLQCPDNCGYRGLPTGPPPLYILLRAVLELLLVVYVCCPSPLIVDFVYVYATRVQVRYECLIVVP